MRLTNFMQSRHGLIALLCVVALHAGLYALLRRSTGWRLRHATEPACAPVTLRLLPWRKTLAQRAPAEPEQMPTPANRPLTARAAITITPPTSTAVSAVSAVNAGRAVNAQAETSTLPELAASQPPRSLDLTLPRGYADRPGSRNPALDDARAITSRTTPEQRMAAALDTRVVEEDLGDGRRRFRQGANCVIVKQSRIGQLMPFNEAAARTPSLVGACP